MRYAYYPGCTLHSSAKEYRLSTEAIAERLGIELAEIPDWNCCGASSAHALNHDLSLALPARNLALAEGMGLDVVAPCAACFNRLAYAQHAVVTDEATAARIGQIAGRPVTGESRVRSLLDVVVSDVGAEALAEAAGSKLEGLKVAAYYGCLLVRPPKVVDFDDPEQPTSLDSVIEAVGAEAVDWSHKTECCGAGLAVGRTDIVVRLVGEILAAAKEAGADLVITACPMCQANLDTRQRAAESASSETFNLPILYFTQLIGLAMGVDPRRLSLQSHTVDGWDLLVSKKVI